MKLISFLLLLFFIYWAVRIAIGAYRIYSKISQAKKQFDDINRQWSEAAGYSSYGADSHQRADTGNSQTARRHTTESGDIIEDRRTEDEINRKIFTHDEGEYVDFEEVEK